MRKSTAKKIGSKKNKFVSNNANSDSSNEKVQKLEDRLLELSDSEIEALFNSGKITQSEYEYILEFRKKKKEKKKSQKQKFEERIRCNNDIIQKVVNLGRKFRVQELLRQSENKSYRNTSRNISTESLLENEQDIEKEERVRDKKREDRSRSKGQKYLDRNERSRGGRER